MNTGTIVAIGVAAAALIGGVAWAASSSTAPGTTPPLPSSLKFQKGHRYQVTLAGIPSVSGGPLATGSPADVAAVLGNLAPGIFKVVSASIVPGGAPGTANLVYVVDALATVDLSATGGTITLGAPASLVPQVVDLGVSPATSPSSTFTRATTIAPGDVVRVSMTQQDLNTVAASIPGATADLAGFQALMSAPAVALVLGGASLQFWGPGQPLPADWPSDDTGAASEYHAQFLYAAHPGVFQPSSNVATFPIPLTFWTSPALSPIFIPGPVGGVIGNIGGGGVPPSGGGTSGGTPPLAYNWTAGTSPLSFQLMRGQDAIFNLPPPASQGWTASDPSPAMTLKAHTAQQAIYTGATAGTVVLRFTTRDASNVVLNAYAITITVV